jgi:hypothetical protein
MELYSSFDCKLVEGGPEAEKFAMIKSHALYISEARQRNNRQTTDVSIKTLLKRFKLGEKYALNKSSATAALLGA